MQSFATSQSFSRLPSHLPFLLSAAMLAAACGDDSGVSSSAGGGGGATSTGSTTAETTTSGSQTTGSQGQGGEAATGSGGSGLGGQGQGGAATGFGPAAVELGAAGDYVILAKSAISNDPTSAVVGDLGLSPAAASYITGLSMTRVGDHWTSAQVTGLIFAADNDPPTPDALTTAVGAMEAAYTDAAGRPTPTYLDLGSGGAIGGLTLEPGLYRWSSTVTVPEDVVVEGSENDRWIFQITGDLNVSAAKRVTLQGGALAKNIVWQVAGEVVVGTNAHAEGIVLSSTAITLETGASINGRLFAQTAVHIAGSAVVAPAD